MNDRCLLFFGDSFVAGAGDAAGLGWPGRVVAAAWDAGLPMTAYNLGVRGETTEQVADRFAAEARPRLIPDADNRAVIAVGANDVSLDEDGSQSISVEDSLAALTRILDEADELGMGSLVLGPGPSGVADHDERSRALGSRFAALAERRGARFLEILDALEEDPDWRRERAGNDGIHPGAGGYAALAQVVLAGGWLEWLRAS